MRVTLKSEGGKAFVSINGNVKAFPALRDALAYIYEVTERNK